MSEVKITKLNQNQRGAASSGAAQINELKLQYKQSANIRRMPEKRTVHSVDFQARDIRAIGFDISGLNKKQLKEMKKIGFDAVIMHCNWNDVQPESGVWNWDKHKRYFDDATSAGLKVFFRGPVHPPDWMDDSHCFRDWEGNSSFHGRTGRVLSFWDTEAQRQIDEFLYQAKTELPWEQFWAIELNIGQGGEARFIGPRFHEDGSNDPFVPLWCFDPYALNAFRMAMRIKYQDDLKAYNKRHGFQHKSWDDVMPARDMSEARFDGDTTAWYQAELVRYVDGMIHRIQPHRRVVIAHAANYNVRSEFWGCGSYELEAPLYEIGRRWEKYFVEVIHFHYALMCFHESIQSVIMQKLSQRKWYAGCQYAEGAIENTEKLRRMGTSGFICGVNDHLFDFADGKPDKLIPEQAEKLKQAIKGV